MATEKVEKCAHPICTCTVSEGKKYCSQYCEDAGTGDVEISCDCRHTGCGIAS